MREACAVVVALAFTFSLPTQARADRRADLAAAIEARDRKHDQDAARALLVPLSTGPRDTAEGRDIAARASFLLGELDESQRDYAHAAAHYRDVLVIDPGNWYAVSARARLDALSSYQGGFGSLSRLDAVRKDSTAANDPAAIDALYRDASDFPAGRVRSEAILFVAEAYVGRLHRAADGVAPALAVAKDAGADPILRAAGYELAYSALHATGDLDRALRELGDDPQAPEGVRMRVHRDVRRRTLHRGSTAVATVGGALFAWALARSVRRRRLPVLASAASDPRALAFIAVTSFGGYLLGERWEAGQGAHFLSFGVALLLVHLLVASWRGAYGDQPAWLRAIGGATAAACVIAAAYLVLERGEARGTPLLQGFGL